MNTAEATTETENTEANWDVRLEAQSEEAGRRAHKLAGMAIDFQDVHALTILDVVASALDDFAAEHDVSAYGWPEHREKGLQQRFRDLYVAARDEKIPAITRGPILALVEHAQCIGPLAVGWLNGIYLNLIEWLLSEERDEEELLEFVVERTADYLVHWKADHEAQYGGLDLSGPVPVAVASAANVLIERLWKLSQPGGGKS